MTTTSTTSPTPATPPARQQEGARTGAPGADPGLTVTMAVEGMSCASCSARVQRALEVEPGVRDAVVNLLTHSATVRFDPELVSADRLLERVQAAGYPATLPDGQRDALSAQLEQADAERRSYRALRRRALVSLAIAALGMVISMPVMAPSPALLSAAGGEHAGHDTHAMIADPFMRWSHGVIDPALQAVMPWLYSAPRGLWIGLLLAMSLLLMGWAGRSFYVRAWAAARHRTGDMNTLVSIGTIAALLYSVFATFWPQVFLARGVMPAIYYEAILFIIALVLMGQTLEARAKQQTSRALRALVALQPDVATVERDGDQHQVPVSALRAGDVVLVRPGERVPVDGVVLSGSGAVDESMLTGESMPVLKEPGSELIGGTLNTTGALRAAVTRVGAASVLAQIVRLMRDAQASRPRIQRLADRVSAVFVPVVLVIAVATLAAWLLLGGDSAFLPAFSASVSVLIIACPCAMGLAVPTAIMVATGRAAEHGILVRGGDAFQSAERVNTVVLDKTGTITEGRPAVVGVDVPGGVNADDVVALAAALERDSEHPLAKAIVDEATSRGLTLQEASGFEALVGRGAWGVVADKPLAIGNRRLVDELEASLPDALLDAARAGSAAGQTAMYVMTADAPDDWTVTGVIRVADRVRERSAEAIARMRRRGWKVVMLTGDNAQTAHAIAAQVGIDRVVAEVLPEGKVAEVQRLRAEGAVVAMVGDGVNDAPALAAADVGVAVASGAHVALEAADVTLMRDDLNGLLDAIDLSGRAMGTMRQNLFWAFIYNTLGIPVAAGVLYPTFGILLSPILASAAMALSSVSVVSNSLRLRRARVGRDVRHAAAKG